MSPENTRADALFDDAGSSDRAEEIAAHYADRLIAGEKVDADEILSAYPTIGPEVLEHLEVFVGVGSQGADCPVGTLGDYTLRRQLGRGGMGVVYEAWENSMDRAVALKVLPAGIAADDKAVTRFVREARLAGKLNHPNVVGVYGMGVKEQTPYFSMEYVEGETLAQILAKTTEIESDSETPFGKKDEQQFFLSLAKAFADVADGLQHAHSKGVVHRDIKPSNLILDADGCLRILDFGLARLEGQESLTLSGDFVGTPLYMSPEQAKRKKIPVDHRTDVYSLGATMYEALCGRPPFRGKDHADTLSQIIERDPVEPRKINSRVPKDLETIVLKCLRKEASDRYGTAEALAQDLRRLVRGDPIEARPEGRWEKVTRRLRRHLQQFPIAAALIVLGIVSLLLHAEKAAEERRRRLKEYRSVVESAALQLEHSALLDRATEGDSRLVSAEEFLGPLDPREMTDPAGVTPLQRVAQDLEEAENLLPERPEAYYYLARTLNHLGRREEALAALDKTLLCEPSFAPARVAREEWAQAIVGARAGTLHRSRERGKNLLPEWALAYQTARRAVLYRQWPEAVTAFTRLLALDCAGECPVFGLPIEALFGRALAHLEAGDLELAKGDLWTARYLWPTAAEPTLALGKVLYLEGKPEEAERLFTDLHAEHGSPDTVALGIAAVLKSLGEYGSGLRWADKIRQTSAREWAKAILHLCLFHWDKAITHSKKAVAAAPEEPAVLLFHARTLFWLWWFSPRDRGDLDSVRDFVGRTLELAPGDHRAIALRGMVLHQAGDVDGALAAAEEAIRVAPTQTEGYSTKVFILWRESRYKEAESLARRLVEFEPRSSHIRNWLAVTLARQWRLDEAIAELEKARKLDPGGFRNYPNLGHYAERQGRYQDALSHFSRALALEPDLIKRNADVSRVLWKLGRVSEALTTLEKAIQADSGLPSLHALHAKILRDQGRFAEAARAYAKVLLFKPGHRDTLEGLAALLSVHLELASDPDVVQAQQAIEEAAPKHTEDAAFLAVLARVRLYISGGTELAEALEAAERAVALLEEKEPDALAALAEVRFVRGEQGEALSLLERAVRLHGARRRHALLLEDFRQRLNPGLTTFTTIDAKLNALDAGRGPVEGALRPAELCGENRRCGSYLQGRLLQAEGRHAEATRLFAALVEGGSECIEPYLRLCECLVAAGRSSDAAAHLEALLDTRFRDNRQAWYRWARILLDGLERSPEDVMALLGEKQAVLPPPAGDLRWLLGQLVHSGAVRLNCGGGELENIAGRGNAFGRDRFFLAGQEFRYPEESNSEATGNPGRFQSARRFHAEELRPGYAIPLPRGLYRVTVSFMERVLKRRGLRIFDVQIEGDTKIESYDPLANAGFGVADEKVFTVEVEDGVLDIEFVAQGDFSAEVFGVEIRSSGSDG